MFIGVLIGFAIGALLTLFVRFPFANWSKFIESAAIGFGIGSSFIVLGWGLNQVVKFMDKQSQEVKGGDAR